MKKRNSFSLIELLIVIFIFVIVMVIASAVTIQIIHAKSKNQAQLQLNQEARNVLETITREARLAQGDSVNNIAPFTTAGNDLHKKDSNGNEIFDGINLNLSPSISDGYSLKPNSSSSGGGNAIVASQKVTTNGMTTATVPEDIELVVDVSGSMSDQKVAIEKAGLDAFIDYFDQIQKNNNDYNLYRMGLVTYASHANTELANPDWGYLESQFPNHSFDDFKSYINTNIKAGYGTDGENTSISDGLYYANKFVTQGRTGVKKVIVLMSDGCNNTPGDWPNSSYGVWHGASLFNASPTCTQSDLQTAITINNRSGVETFSIGFNQPGTSDGCFNGSAMQQIATSPDDYYEVSAMDGSDLINAYKNVAIKAAHGTISTQTIPPTNLTSSTINVDGLEFSIDNSSGQPYLNITLTVKPANYNSLPAWKQASVTIKTGVSSRSYK